MVEQQYFDSETDQEFTGLRCISCGDIVDPVILAHRQRSGSVRTPEPADMSGLRELLSVA
jgi:hypothetical protein